MQDLIEEDEVRDIGLTYLRHYYKFWPRSSEIALQKNLRAEGGLVVDGLLTFERPEGGICQIVLEATDFHLRNELWFTVLWPLAAWDAAAAASLVGSSAFLSMQLTNNLKWSHAHPVLFATFFLLAALMLTYLVYRLLYRLKRYRYIHAIEQFQQYEAEAQWIAFSWDVFSGYGSAEFRELNDQCIQTGTGLLEIRPDKSVKPHVTPSRQRVIGAEKRRLVRFIQDTEWIKFVKSLPKKANGREWLANRLRKLSGYAQVGELVRFPRPIWKQVAICFFSTSLVFLTLWREYLERPIHFVDEQQYTQQMENRGVQLSQEGAFQMVSSIPDSTDLVPFQREVAPYLSIEPDTAFLQWDQSQPGLLVLESKRLRSFPCATIQLDLTKKYLVIAGDFFEKELVENQLYAMQQASIQVKALFLGCFFPKKGYYVLWDGPGFSSLEEANRRAANLRALFSKEGFSYDVQVIYLEK